MKTEIALNGVPLSRSDGTARSGCVIPLIAVG